MCPGRQIGEIWPRNAAALELEGETRFSLENSKSVLVYQHLEFHMKWISDLCTPELKEYISVALRSTGNEYTSQPQAPYLGDLGKHSREHFCWASSHWF